MDCTAAMGKLIGDEVWMTERTQEVEGMRVDESEVDGATTVEVPVKEGFTRVSLVRVSPTRPAR
jgi:hypothetical protein